MSLSDLMRFEKAKRYDWSLAVPRRGVRYPTRDDVDTSQTVELRVPESKCDRSPDPYVWAFEIRRLLLPKVLRSCLAIASLRLGDQEIVEGSPISGDFFAPEMPEFFAVKLLPREVISIRYVNVSEVDVYADALLVGRRVLKERGSDVA